MTTVDSVCLKCGVTKRSGKISCCGRGGSWFNKCGSDDDTHLDHTWHEGLQSSKARAQSKAVIAEQLKSGHQHRNGSAKGEGGANSEVLIAAARPVASTASPMAVDPEVTMPAHMSINMMAGMSVATANSSTSTSGGIPASRDEYALSTSLVHTRATARGCKQMLAIIVHFSLLLTNVLFYR